MGVTAQEKKPEDAAVARTRKQVLMLDDLYKTAIVLITENYVKEDSDLAAGAAVSEAVRGDAEEGPSRRPPARCHRRAVQRQKRAPGDFEKAAIAALKSGKPTYEQLTEQDGKRVLKLATPIPVVMKKCIMCHPAYEKAAAGQPIESAGLYDRRRVTAVAALIVGWAPSPPTLLRTGGTPILRCRPLCSFPEPR